MQITHALLQLYIVDKLHMTVATVEVELRWP